VLGEKSYFQSDLDEICAQSKSFLSEFSNKTILIAGATGFVGSWLVSSLEHMNATYNSNLEIVALSRSGSNRIPGSPANTKTISLDLTDQSSKLELKFDCIFNCATPSSRNHGGLDTNQVLASSIIGTKSLLNLCIRNSKPTFINLSSGIITKRSMDFDLDLMSIKDAYLHGKRVSESLILEAVSAGNIKGRNLRLYAFAGPGIPLDQHFAAGNFMNDAIHGRPISIKGNPATLRSYLYPTDMIVNILNCAAKDSLKEIEIGSQETVSMHRLAETINEVTGNSGIMQQPDYGPADEYIPQLEGEAITASVSLPEALTRWNDWLR
jgi:nucleoside-diphosphate-sugar epimerase